MPVASVVDVVVAALLVAAQVEPVHTARRPALTPPADVNVPPTTNSAPSSRTTSPLPPVRPLPISVHVPPDNFAMPAAGTELTLVNVPVAYTSLPDIRRDFTTASVPVFVVVMVDHVPDANFLMAPSPLDGSVPTYTSEPPAPTATETAGSVSPVPSAAHALPFHMATFTELETTASAPVRTLVNVPATATLVPDTASARPTPLDAKPPPTALHVEPFHIAMPLTVTGEPELTAPYAVVKFPVT